MKKNISSVSSNSYKFSLVILLIALVILPNNRVISVSISKNYKLTNISVNDLSGNGQHTWACSASGQIVKILDDDNTKVFSYEIENISKKEKIPKCARIEVTFDSSFYVVSDEGDLTRFVPTVFGFFDSIKIASDVVDIGSNLEGATFYINKKNELYKIGNKDLGTKDFKPQKYFKFKYDVERIDVGTDKDGNTYVLAVTKKNELVKFLIPQFILDDDKTTKGFEAINNNKEEILDIYATDIAVGSDGRIYVASGLFGSFVYNEKSEKGFGKDWDHIATFGEQIAAGYELYIVSKAKRLLKTTLVEN
jgi:hypothetical protein